ncbi:MAG: glycosyltransferase family 1 protein [Candidatus Atelocyanobacterium thalassa]|uniref:Glycosyltransferase n=1 Tax=Candidatus Atelocyanobacterium thalassa isolate SIO64986 TaxID=1527444 RepID=A0A086CIA8_9CHRO|nr:MAG: hypothetical protein ucyna2_00303 [Candidatus Atelocyanobacterium thalassa isolate SIO64986]
MNRNEEKQLTPVFVSLVPNLMEGQGHIIPYHKSVGEAISQLGWKHCVAVPINNKVYDLPVNWDACLNTYDLEKKGSWYHKLFHLQEVWILGKNIANYLNNKVVDKSRPHILFLERFIHLQLLALFLCLLLIPTNNLSIWLLYRRDTHKDNTKIIYKILNYLIKIRIKSGRFQLLTDSDLLSEQLSNYFHIPVKVFPIPHTEVSSFFNTLNVKSEILCWWPGSPREEKGWQTIKKLVNYSGENTKNIHFICSEAANLEPVQDGVNLKLIKSYLTRKEYYCWLHLSQVILLPYNSFEYESRTSGIFTECIVSGKIPLVTNNTWMSHECTKYNLTELIIDWHNPEYVFDSIKKIAESNTIQNKIQNMRESYKNFHNISNYSLTIKNLYQEMIISNYD